MSADKFLNWASYAFIALILSVFPLVGYQAIVEARDRDFEDITCWDGQYANAYDTALIEYPMTWKFTNTGSYVNAWRLTLDGGAGVIITNQTCEVRLP